MFRQGLVGEYKVGQFAKLSLTEGVQFFELLRDGYWFYL